MLEILPLDSQIQSSKSFQFEVTRSFSYEKVPGELKYSFEI